PPSPPFPYTTLFRSIRLQESRALGSRCGRSADREIGRVGDRQRLRSANERLLEPVRDADAAEKRAGRARRNRSQVTPEPSGDQRSEEHTSELQSLAY